MILDGAWELGGRVLTEGGEVAYGVFGEGPPVVLVHGTPSRSSLWRGVAGRLAGRHAADVHGPAGLGGVWGGAAGGGRARHGEPFVSVAGCGGPVGGASCGVRPRSGGLRGVGEVRGAGRLHRRAGACAGGAR